MVIMSGTTWIPCYKHGRNKFSPSDSMLHYLIWALEEICVRSRGRKPPRCGPPLLLPVYKTAGLLKSVQTDRMRSSCCSSARSQTLKVRLGSTFISLNWCKHDGRDAETFSLVSSWTRFCLGHFCVNALILGCSCFLLSPRKRLICNWTLFSGSNYWSVFNCIKDVWCTAGPLESVQVNPRWIDGGFKCLLLTIIIYFLIYVIENELSWYFQ